VRLAGLALVVALLGALMVPAAVSADVRASDRVVGRSAKDLSIPSAAMPDVKMVAGVLMTEDGRVLWARRPADRRAMASITKLMTAVVALENAGPGDMVTVPKASGEVGESTSFLRPGEKLPMSEILEALLVKSGNDAAIAIAQHVAGDDKSFVALMNAKAVGAQADALRQPARPRRDRPLLHGGRPRRAGALCHDQARDPPHRR